MKRIIMCFAMAIAVAAILLVPVGVGAGISDSGTTTISGTVGQTMTVTVPSNFDMPPFVLGSTVNTEGSPKSVIVNTNLTSWGLTAMAHGNYPGGKMKAGTISLAHPIRIKGGTMVSYADLSDAALTTVAAGQNGPQTITVNFSQQVAANEPAGTYQIIVVIAASGS